MGKRQAKALQNLSGKGETKGSKKKHYTPHSGAGSNHNVRGEDYPRKRNLALQVPTSIGGLEEAQTGS